MPEKPKPEPTTPAKSWWIDQTTREAFDAAVKRESERMRQIKVFGLPKRGSDPSGKGRW